MCGAQTRSPGAASAAVEQGLAVLERRRHRLLDEHVLAGLERRARERAVLLHAREDEHGVDVVVLADREVRRARRGVRSRRRGGGLALGRVGVVHRGDRDAALARQALDQGHVRRPEDAAAADDAEPDGHGALRAVA